MKESSYNLTFCNFCRIIHSGSHDPCEDMLKKETQELILKSRNGDMQAFRSLVEWHQQYVYQIAYRVVRSEEDARDIVQEVFVKVWQHLSKFRAKHQFTTWLYRITVNAALDKMRQKKHHTHVTFADDSSRQFTDFEKNPETTYINNETRMLIQQTIDLLPEKQRLVFILRDLEELSIRETAAILNCSQQNIKSHLYHARRRIREIMIKSEGE